MLHFLVFLFVSEEGAACVSCDINVQLKYGIQVIDALLNIK